MIEAIIMRARCYNRTLPYFKKGVESRSVQKDEIMVGDEGIWPYCVCFVMVITMYEMIQASGCRLRKYSEAIASSILELLMEIFMEMCMVLFYNKAVNVGTCSRCITAAFLSESQIYDDGINPILKGGFLEKISLRGHAKICKGCGQYLIMIFFASAGNSNNSFMLVTSGSLKFLILFFLLKTSIKQSWESQQYAFMRYMDVTNSTQRAMIFLIIIL